MSRKKILVIDSGSLFPLIMASQDRVFKMVKRLAQDHKVDIASIITDLNQLNLSKENLLKQINTFYPVISLNYNKKRFRRKIIGLKWLFNYLFFGTSSRHFYWGHKRIIKQLEHIVTRNRYDIVQLEGWYSGRILSRVSTNTYKVIDTHDVLYEKKEKEYKDIFGDNLPFLKKRELLKYKEAEIAVTKSADMVISLSEYDRNIFRALAPKLEHILIPTGQDIYFYKNYSLGIEDKLPTILFYGFLGSRQNIDAFFRLYNKIFPLVIKLIPEVRLLVLGGNPSKEIIRLNERSNIEVTGFVEDVRPFIARSSIKILPMDLAGGFRSRVVEVMAMGVPVLGTHNALDSIGFSNGIEGIIEDDDRLLAESAVKLLTNSSSLKSMSRATQVFAEKKYNIEATYGKLSKYYSALS